MGMNGRGRYRFACGVSKSGWYMYRYVLIGEGSKSSRYLGKYIKSSSI